MLPNLHACRRRSTNEKNGSNASPSSRFQTGFSSTKSYHNRSRPSGRQVQVQAAKSVSDDRVPRRRQRRDRQTPIFGARKSSGVDGRRGGLPLCYTRTPARPEAASHEFVCGGYLSTVPESPSRLGTATINERWRMEEISAPFVSNEPA